MKLAKRKLDGAWQMVCVVKTTPDGEWDFEEEDEDRVEEEEIMDDGKSILRVGQQDAIAAGLRAAIDRDRDAVCARRRLSQQLS